MEPFIGVPGDASSVEARPDWALLLPWEAFAEIMVMLRAGLPAPVGAAAGDRVRRDRAAMAAVGALAPATAAEGRLAAQFVMGVAWAADCLREAAERWRETDTAHRWRAQALGFAREARSALGLLLRLRGLRVAADGVAAGRDERVEHAVVSMMAEVLGPSVAAGGGRVKGVTRDTWKFGFVPDLGIVSGVARVETVVGLGV